MYSQVEKQRGNKSRAVANSVAQKKSNGKQGFGFVDNRPDAVAQRKLQEMINNSSQVRQLKAYQEMANNNMPPIQLKAWHKRRPLSQADGDTSEKGLINGRGVLHHAHIIFDKGYTLPIVGASDNIGYHAVHGASGPGELFSENVGSKGYKTVSEISTDNYEDRILIQSIKKNQNFGDYKLVSNDCQSWVEKVKKDYDYDRMKPERAELQTKEERESDILADMIVKAKMDTPDISGNKTVFDSVTEDQL